MRKLIVLICIVLTGGLLGTLGVAQAVEAPSLNFVLGVPGKTGCLVCHGDPKISKTKTKLGAGKNLYLSEITVSESVHKDIACIACHTDFKLLTASKDHKPQSSDYRIIAGLSCKNCHQHSKQLKEYGRSVHGKLALSGDPKGGATCADCHGSHDIQSLKKNKAYRDEFHVSGAKTCGKCHKDFSDSYNDYYHGKAYHQKATDAPACWDCHSAHDIQSADVPTSKVADKQLAKTCGSCHIDSRDEFAAQYGKMIHGSKKVIKNNFVLGFAGNAWSWIETNVIGKIGEYYDSAMTSLFSRDRK